MGINKQNKRTWLFIGFFLLAGMCYLLNRTSITWLNSLLFSMNFAIYAGLLLFWIQSVRVRLLPTNARSYILSAAVLMLGALILRVFRYRIVVTGTVPSRYAAYSYWLYTLLIPTLFLMTAIRIRQGAETSGKRKELLLLIPTLALCIFGLTNDLHRLVYIPTVPLSSFDINTGLYTYGVTFYLLFAWMGLMAASGIVILLRVTQKRASGVMGYVLLVLGLWLSLELLNIFVIEPHNLRRMYATPEIRIFSMLAIFEICIRSRLIPHNENHVGFFEKLTLPVLITDRELAPVYRSAIPINAEEDELRRALETPVYLSEDLKLSGMALTAGYAFWTEDERELHRENRRLASANELLSEENDLIRVENELKEKKARLDAEEKVYEQIALAIYPKQKQIETLLENTAPEKEDFSAALAKVCVLNAYSKRKSNLLLLSEAGLPKSNRELFLALQESARFLSGCGIEAAAVGEEYTDFPLPLVHALYDTFEAVLEAWLPQLKRMTVSMRPDGIRMAVEASGMLALPKTPLPVERKESDELTFLTIRAGDGGDAA
ncbi:MAG: hypothetical protein IJU78_00400 [Clostridia bacterium]|nr:hypothetical protein [Clostridia bacterium]